jgi:hypothetical protein
LGYKLEQERAVETLKELGPDFREQFLPELLQSTLQTICEHLPAYDLFNSSFDDTFHLILQRQLPKLHIMSLKTSGFDLPNGEFGLKNDLYRQKRKSFNYADQVSSYVDKIKSSLPRF